MNRNAPVVLVHGFMYTGRKMNPLARHLRKRGWIAHTLDLTPCWGQAGIEVLAGQLAAFLERTFDPEQKVNLVGFSMGGLVCRYYLQRMGGLPKAAQFITISSPHHGTVLAKGWDRPGCVQMRPGSAFLADLNRDAEVLEQVNFASIWTPLDLMILPPKSSRMSFGEERVLWIAAHPLMVLQSSALNAVAELLER